MAAAPKSRSDRSLSAPRSAARNPDTALSIYCALGANLAITLIKFWGAAYTGSGALMAEALHSLADSANEGFLLLGRKQARKAPTAHHPLGYGRATYFWAFVVALLLFTVGGLFSIYEGIEKLHEPHTMDSPLVAVGIMLFAMIAELISLTTTLKEIGKVRGERSLWRWFRETRRGELIVVLGEDAAAIAGLLLALIALSIAIATGNSAFDALGSIAVGALLVIAALVLAVEIKSLLIGESASPRTERAIRSFLRNQPGIAEVAELITMQHGEDLIIAIEARMQAASVAELVKAITECKRELRASFPAAKWVFLEPVGGQRRRPPAR